MHVSQTLTNGYTGTTCIETDLVIVEFRDILSFKRMKFVFLFLKSSQWLFRNAQVSADVTSFIFRITFPTSALLTSVTIFYASLSSWLDKKWVVRERMGIFVRTVPTCIAEKFARKIIPWLIRTGVVNTRIRLLLSHFVVLLQVKIW